MCYKNQGKNRQFTAGAVLFAEANKGKMIKNSPPETR